MKSRALLFSYDDATFMLPAEWCRQLFAPAQVLPLPAAQRTLLGLTEVQGRAVPLLDLAALHALHEHYEGSAVAPAPTLALLVEFGSEPLALPVAHMLGVSAVGVLPDARDVVFESVQTQGRDALYIHLHTLLGTVRTRLLHA